MIAVRQGDTTLHALRPFLKWAGGKTHSLPHYRALYPKKFKGYHEPFLGSGAVYFHLCQLQMSEELPHSMTRARLTDNNPDLINAYQVVQNFVTDLIQLLLVHREYHSPEYYYEMRGLNTSHLTDIERAARMIYLNKTCFNGLYRVNKQGQFNVPLGRYANPHIFDEENLLAVSAALRQAEIRCESFRRVIDEAKPGDFIYFDPPYYPLNETSNFTSFTVDEFNEFDHRLLADVYRQLDRRGCMVMLSNSSAPFVMNLYEGFKRLRVKAARLINSKSDRRGKIIDLVILNY